MSSRSTKPVDPMLFNILTTKRFAKSEGERKIIEKYIEPLNPFKDEFGNYHKIIGNTPILWSCHTDTVHKGEGTHQLFWVNDRLVAGEEHPCVLGADDGAGMWLMLKMIQRKVPGIYVFHREEEIGGRGSSFIAKTRRPFLALAKCAIALDRRGVDSVVTFQGTRCCSDEFAQSLADQLGGEFKPDPTGMFTDTANYTDDIGECTNISVGYYAQHSTSESLDVEFLQSLLEKLTTLDFSKLVLKRKPGEIEYKYTNGRTFGTYNTWDDTDCTYVHAPLPSPAARYVNNNSPRAKDVLKKVMKHPQALYHYLRAVGHSIEEVEDILDDYIWEHYEKSPKKKSKGKKS